MIGRKNIGRSSPVLLVLLALGFFFATYNLITLIIHNKASISGSWMWDGTELFDPVIQRPDDEKSAGNSKKYHVALTATDAPYSQWQCRIMYYWYKKMKDMPGSDMGKFTRVLHSGSPDNLMEEIPSFVVDPLPQGLDRGYIVLNRPWAFVQWLEKATIEEEYILMAEPDHVFANPLPNLGYGDHPAGFPFFYIKPTENEKIIRKFYPKEKGPVSDVDPIGNSPVIIKKSLLEDIAPTWVNVSLRMKDDEETDKAFGWVLEMYAYAVASALHGVHHTLRKDFMLQPPWDLEVGKKFIIHYTYGCDYNLKGELTYGKIGEWRFDKRSYLSGPPPRNLPLPPPGVPESVVRLVKMVNEATANIPGWDTLSSG
ncbi:hydroxyproline O-arabinosyltransferase PLENTY [Ziziphus jujuba]|uniref:Hydroxyproline O-arabinosyltransferase PLENTY n=5 Tax=Ziziphus jujuba TaxID=326968 RepID=A0A6P3Z792_ZIZJJ|nr:hydroxyproline O-arabinosyltransferase PLENTY [Ziziphus jujuba]XP_015873648.3 hydroxyproline O-arabinosyltransferase PLENTY [Ziziphus jujuba]XP_015873649.3 hydroxyproline O-arabinosyltransferase PLENTY [Ziziphus jujuba]XP_015873652.3 hydroxyproline O-arabinosyltransferase PLENTY [Ziziphus jujuba]